MTEREQELIKELTKQLELNNKIAMTQMQQMNEPTETEKILATSEMKLMTAKEHFFNNGSTLLSTLNIFIGLIAVFTCIALFVGIAACASAF